MQSRFGFAFTKTRFFSLSSVSSFVMKEYISELNKLLK